MGNKNKLNLISVRNSDLYGFWRRLKSMGYKPYEEFRTPYTEPKDPNYDPNNPTIYTQTIWTFIKENSTVAIRIRRYSYRMTVFEGDKKLFDSKEKACWSWLEKPFLKYFNQRKPLCLRRIYDQNRIIGRLSRQQPRRMAKRKGSTK